MSVEEYNGMKYGLFNVYFQYVNSSIPWASSYSQGMAAGLYAQAYNKTKDQKYLDQSKNSSLIHLRYLLNVKVVS